MMIECEKCSHFTNYDGADRCSYYHDSLCSKVKSYCNNTHYLDKDDGVSLYSLKSWLNRLSRDEMELPLVFEDTGTHRLLLPLLVIRTMGKDFDKWVFHSKGGDDY